MPEAEEAVADNLEAQAQDAAVTDGNAPGQDNAPATNLIPDKFKSVSKEDLIKSYLGVEHEKGRLADEIGRIRTEMEQLKSQNEMAKAIAAIAESKKPKEETPATNIDQFLDELEADGVSKVAAKKLIGLNNNWLSATEKKMREELESTRKSLEELRQHTYEEMERMSPDYQQNRVVIDRMVAGGMKLSAARALVKELSEADSSAPARLERATPPASIAPSRVIPKQTQPAYNEYLLTLDDVRAVNPDMTEENMKIELTRINAARLARIKKGEDQRDSIYKRSLVI